MPKQKIADIAVEPARSSRRSSLIRLYRVEHPLKVRRKVRRPNQIEFDSRPDPRSVREQMSDRNRRIQDATDGQEVGRRRAEFDPMLVARDNYCRGDELLSDRAS